MITVDYENLIQETKSQKEQIKVLEEELEKKKQVEDSVKETVDAARNLMKDVSDSAEKRAEIVLKNAEMDAEIIIKKAEAEAQRYKDEISLMQNRMAIFNERFKNLLNSELDRFSDSLKDADNLLQE